ARTARAPRNARRRRLWQGRGGRSDADRTRRRARLRHARGRGRNLQPPRQDQQQGCRVMAAKRYVIGVDVGGTFTDIFVYDQIDRKVQTTKIPSTRGDQSKGFAEGIARIVPDFSEIATVVHGTTVGTNALLERKGSRTGIITTKGFRDVIEMRRRDRPTTWGLWG